MSEWVGGEVALPLENKAKVQHSSPANSLLTRLTRAKDTECVVQRALEIQGNSNADEESVAIYCLLSKNDHPK